MLQRRSRTVAAAAGPTLLVWFLAATMLVRVLTDDRSAPNSRQSGGLNLSAGIALLFILVAAGLLLRRRRGVRATALAALWLSVWTVVALHTSGTSTETLREGVREASVAALAVIVYNGRQVLTASIAARLVQFVGLAPAVVALYQLATHTSANIAGVQRANGTFAHPNSAAMFFAIAAVASLWLYLDNGRLPFDAFLLALFASALIVTFSIDGLITLITMLMAFAALHPGSWRVKLGPMAIAALVLLAFFATPLGSHRLSKETSTSLAAADRGETNSSLDWRLHKWKTLVPEWEDSPVLGRGLGTTTTVQRIPGDLYTGEPPHNEYVRYLVETGCLGLITLLWGAFLLCRQLFRRKRIDETLEAGGRNAAVLAISVVVGCLINSLADNTLLNSPTCYAAALIVVAILVLPDQGMGKHATQVS